MPEKQEILTSGNIRLDIASGRLDRAGERVELRHKHMKLLHELMRRPGELVSKRELIDLGWGKAPVTDAVLTTAIKEIRRALGDDAKAPWAVENVHARGYRFLPPVEAAPANEGASEEEALTTAAPANEERPTAARAPSPLIRVAAVAGVLVLALLTLVLLQPRAPTPEASPPHGNAIPAIAVLPLDDMSPQGDQRWFADGLAEEILNELAQSSALRVASRTSAFRFRESEEDIRDIAAALGVDYVMEGSVRTAGERLRVTVQLIRADDGLHVLSESWNRPFDIDQVFDVQGEISQQVLEVLNRAIGAAPMPAVAVIAHGDIDLTAYEQFLQGRELIRTRTPQNLAEGIDLLEASIATSPDYAPSHATLALGILLSSSRSGAPLEDARGQAAAHLRTAMALDPNSPDALTAAALHAMMEGDPKRSLALSEQALDLSPNAVEAQFRRSIALGMLGRPQEAYEASQRAALLDPLSPTIAAGLVAGHLYNRKEALALEMAEKVFRWNSEHAVAQASLGLVLHETGQYARAYQLLDQAWRGNATVPHYVILRNDLLWRLGAGAELMATDSPSAWNVRAAIALAHGDKASAVALARASHTPSSRIGIDAFDVAYWAGDEDLSRSLAEASIERLGMNAAQLGPSYPRALHQAIVALGDGPHVDELRALMASRFAEWTPPPPNTPVRAQEFLGAAAWRVLNEDSAGALEWLEQAAERGFILSELRLDPLFDSLRQEPRFRAVLTAMDASAARQREALGI